MSSAIRIAIALAMMAISTTTSARSEVVCPPATQGDPLDRMSLFVGDPRNLVELAPVTPPSPRGFIYDWRLRSSAGLVALCRYRSGVTIQINLSAGLQECRVDHSPVKTTARCW